MNIDMAQLQDTVNTSAGLIIRGVAGTASIQAADIPATHTIEIVGKLLIQIAIACVTIWSIVKKSNQPTIVVQNGQDVNNVPRETLVK